MNKIKTIKIRNEDGSISEESYLIAADALNIDMINGKNVQETIGTIDIDIDGNIAEQLKNLKKDVRDKIYFFDTVSDMKSANLKENDYVYTLGYYKIDDGGNGLYKIVSSSNKYTENLNNDLKAELIIENVTNIKCFGAYGDEIHDDTNAIEKAINYGTGIIFFPKGTFLVSNSINLKSNLYIYGCETDSIITAHEGITIFKNNENQDLENVHIEKITFLGNVYREPNEDAYPRRDRTFKNTDYGTGLQVAIALTGSNAKRKDVQGKVYNIEINNCNFLDIWSLPVLINGAELVSFHNNYTDNCLDIGFIDCENLFFNSNYIIRGSDNGVSISSGNNHVTCSNNIILWCADNGIWISGWPVQVDAIDPDTGETEKINKMFYGPTNVVVTGNIVKHSGHTGILAKWYVDNVIISNNIIDDCRFNYNGQTAESAEAGNGIGVAGYDGITVENGIKITETKYASKVTITGNKISNCERGGINLTRVLNFSIINNTFENLGAKKLPNGQDIDATLTSYNYGIYVANYNENLDAQGLISMNSFRETREDKTSYNYLNWKYALSRCPNIKIKDNIFYDYNDARCLTYLSKEQIMIDDFLDNKWNSKLLRLEPSNVQSLQDIYDIFFSSTGQYYELTWFQPISISYSPEVINLLTESTSHRSSGFGIMQKASSDGIIFFEITIPSEGIQYTGRLLNNELQKLTQFSGTAIK